MFQTYPIFALMNRGLRGVFARIHPLFRPFLRFPEILATCQKARQKMTSVEKHFTTLLARTQAKKRYHVRALQYSRHAAFSSTS